MADFLHEYLMGRFALERMVAEWGYNLNDACQRYAEDESVGTFWNILNGDVRFLTLLQRNIDVQCQVRFTW